MQEAKVDLVLSRIEKLKQTSTNKWLACCPAHDDRNASLGIKLADEGRILLHCFAGCSVYDIVASIGLNMSDLFPRNSDSYKKRARPPKFSASEMVGLCVFEATLICIAMADVLHGQALNAVDLVRVQRALDTIEEIRREVTHVK